MPVDRFLDVAFDVCEAGYRYRRSPPAEWVNRLAATSGNRIGLIIAAPPPHAEPHWHSLDDPREWMMRVWAMEPPRPVGLRAPFDGVAFDRRVAVAPAACPARGRVALALVHADRVGAGDDPHELWIARTILALAVRLAETFTDHVAPLEDTRGKLLESLTDTKQRVLRLLIEGLREQEIAARFHRSPHTIHDHVKAIYRTLGVSSRDELLRLWTTGERR